MAQLVGGAIGAAIGFYIGGPQGAQIGFALGSAAGGYLAAPDIEGPRLDDLKAPKVSYGAVIPYVEGHPPLPGVVVWSSNKREIANSTSAKGGPEATSFTYVIDALYTLAENEIGDIRRVWLNGELVWSNSDDASDETVEASTEAPWSRITLYRGSADQLPDPTYEAAVGVGNAPAYRTRTTVFIQDLQLTGDQLPVLKFECGGLGPEQTNVVIGFHAPLAFDVNDIIPPETAGNVVGGGFDGLSFDGEWAKLEYQSPLGPTIFWDVAKYNEYVDDFSEDISYMVTISELNALDGFLGSNSQVLFTLRNTPPAAPVGIGLAVRYTGGETIQLQIVRSFSGGTTVIETVGSLPKNTTEAFTFRFEVVSNPGAPSEPVTTKMYVGSDYPGSSFYPNETLLAEHQTFNFNRFVVQGETLDNPPDARSGVKSFKAKNVIAYRGDMALAGRTVLREPTLQDVVERQCARAGIPAEYVDATDLATRFVSGIALTQIVSPRNVIDTLARAYFFSAVESEVLRFKFLGGDIVETLPYEVLGAALDTPASDPLPIVLANDIELPVQVYVKYINGDDDYQDGNEQSFRVTNSPGNTSAVELPLVFTPTEAKRIADVAVSLGKLSSQRFGPLSLTREYSHLEPTDPVLLTDRNGNTYRARLTTHNGAQGVLTFEAVLDDATIIDSAAETSGGYNNSTVVAPKVATEFEPLDIPLLRDVDDLTGIYWGAGGAAGWPGAVWQQSADDTSFANISDTTRNTIIGVTDGTLANWAGGNFFDEASVLRVNIGYGALSSYTRDDVLNNGAGGYLVGNELIQARNATLVSEGVYDLTGLLRGRRGTEWAMTAHAANERFVVLSPDTLNRQPLNVSDIGSTIFWKAVTFGRLATTATSESLVFGSVSQRPFSPVDLRGERDSGDLTLTWRRRTRLSTNFNLHLYPLGEASEAYQVVVYVDNTYTTVKRVITATSQTATYTSADQTTDFGSPQATVYTEVFQISATAGRGYALRGAI